MACTQPPYDGLALTGHDQPGRDTCRSSSDSAGTARAGNWAPFAPHGWLSVGSAAATLMFSFVGWEAVAPLTTRFADPCRQLPRVVAIALAVTTVLYLVWVPKTYATRRYSWMMPPARSCRRTRK
jgi:hypothetical protein